MKKVIKLIVLTAIIISAVCLAGCVNISSTYDNADKYTPGNREVTEKISDFDLNWSSGTVTVTRYSGSTISVQETCDSDLSDDKRVHTWVDGNTLHVQFCKSGEVFVMKNGEKKLEIKIPENLEIKGISYDGSSADATFENLTTDSFKADTSSGDLKLISCTSKTFDIESSSGEIDLIQRGESDRISVEASSGDISVSAETVKDLTADVSSGKIKLDAKRADSVTTDASSGDARLAFENVPSNMKLESSSGEITVSLPKNADFKAEVDTSSGKFESDIPCSKNGDTYTSGNGSNNFNFETSSGDIQIKANN